MADNRSRLVAAGLEVVDFPILPTLEVDGEEVAVGHLNFYLCNGAVIVPGRRGLTTDAEALERIGAVYPDREVVGVPGRGHRLRRRRPALHHPAGPGRRGA